MRAELWQEQRLQLSLTKELVQAIELLQYSAVDLEAFLHEQSLENPFLEIRRTRVRQRPSRTERDQKQWLENIGARAETLVGHLLSQLPALKLADREERIVRYLIASLDEDGYLRVPLAELAARFSASEQEMERGLRLVQSLDPPGVGARDLAECLLLQLERLPERDELAETIEVASSAQVKSIIQELIAAEDRQAPLSDQQLADLLHGRYGIAISRRTVAKYREQLRIPSSAKRKQYTGA